MKKKSHTATLLQLALAVLAVAATWPARADVVTDWNQTAIKTVLENPPGGLTSIRNLAIVHLAARRPRRRRWPRRTACWWACIPRRRRRWTRR